MMVKLGDIASYVNGYAFKPSDWSDEGLPIIRIQDLTGNSYQANRYNGAYHPKYEVNEGDVLISWSASLGVYVWKGERAVLNQHIFKVVFDKEEVDKSYFVHQVQNILENAASEAHGATMKHLTKPVFDALPFYLPTIEQQKEIACVLDRVSELIALRKEQLVKLDQLIKSRFVEMFGDGRDDRFSIKTLSQIISQNKHALKRGPFGGALKKDDFVESGFLVYEQRHAIHNDFAYEKYYITPEKYQEMIMFSVVPGDLIISCSGVTLGRIAEIPIFAKKGIINQALLKVSLDQSVMTNTFFIHQFRSERVQDILFGFCRGSGIPNFPSMSEVKAVPFICPPIAMQKQFATFVEQTEKTKLTIQSSLDKLEVLKKSLMQDYFY